MPNTPNPPHRDDIQKSMTIDQSAHGIRLDQAIAPLFPEMGVRGRRRLWEHYHITVNGRPRPCGFFVSIGDVVLVQKKEACEMVHGTQNAQEDSIQEIDIIHVNNKLGLAAIYKPSALHSAAIVGSPTPSVEALLPYLDFSMLSNHGTAHALCAQGFPKLLNRLDGPTSGMLLVALDEAGFAVWNEAEELGDIEKIYFAVAYGVIKKAQTVKTALHTAHCQVTKILNHETEDSLRHTELMPLAVFDMALQEVSGQGGARQAVTSVTLIQCRIHKGARHQIRAHMASIGHPLLGDTVYGETVAEAMPTQLFLHHGRVHIADFTAWCLPPWLALLPHEGQEKIILCARDA